MRNPALQTDRKNIVSVGINPAHDFDSSEDPDDIGFLRRLYPMLSNDRLLETKERLDGYFGVALEAFLERLGEGNIDDDKMNS